MLLDCYSPTPYHYATRMLGHLPPVKCPLSPASSQMPCHFWSLAPLG